MHFTTIFDAGKGYDSITALKTFTDCTLAKRDNQWWMFACGHEQTSFTNAGIPENAVVKVTGATICGVCNRADVMPCWQLLYRLV